MTASGGALSDQPTYVQAVLLLHSNLRCSIIVLCIQSMFQQLVENNLTLIIHIAFNSPKRATTKITKTKKPCSYPNSGHEVLIVRVIPFLFTEYINAQGVIRMIVLG